MTETTLDPLTALGQLLWLCSHAEKTTDEPVGTAAAGFQKAISTGDFQIYRAEDGKPFACVCWLWLREECEAEAVAAMQAGNFTPSDTEKDWFGGDRLWFFNFFAPFGHGKHIANDLCATKFPNIDPDVFPMDENGKHGEFTFFRAEVRQTEPA